MPESVAYPSHHAPESAYWDRVVEDWTPNRAHQLWRAHSDAVNADLLRRWLHATPGVILKTDLFDEAVGQGLYPQLAARSPEIVGIDVSSAVVSRAARRYPDLDARVASVLSLPFSDASFDTVFSNSTLDHFTSHTTLRAAVVELARIIRPGGRLIVTLDNRMNPVVAVRTSTLAGVLRRTGVVPYFVGATYGPRGLSRLLRETGFQVKEISSVMHCPPQLAASWAGRRHGESASTEAAHLRQVLRFEAMGRLPTRYLTGHFVGALAVRR